jgi:hypothetical protein
MRTPASSGAWVGFRTHRTPSRSASLLAVCLMLGAACGCAGHEQRVYRIYPDKLKQTLDFEINILPGQVFKVVIPEIITDRQETLLGWNESVSHWDIGPEHASWDCEIPGVIRANSSVLFGQELIEARVRMTNLSQRTWELANAFTCFAFYEAPLFDNPELDRIFFPVDGRWRSVADLFAQTNPGDGPYTFFSVKGGPQIRDIRVVRLVRQTHPQAIDYGAGCVVSKDGQWVAGVSTGRPAYVFCNRRERCIHANPLYGPIAPGQTAEDTTYIRIMRGGLTEFEKAVRTAGK